MGENGAEVGVGVSDVDAENCHGGKVGKWESLKVGRCERALWVLFEGDVSGGY